MDRPRFGMLLWLWLAFAALPSLVHAQAPIVAAAQMDNVSAVNMAGRQRMLSQRMTKAYLMTGQGIATDDAQAILQGSIIQFETQLAALKAFQPTPLTRSAVANLETAWAKCKPVLTATPSLAGAADLYDLNEELQKAAHRATLAYQDVNGAALDHLVNLAGRQRMLSQRMAKFYFYRSWGLSSEASDMELHLSRAHFTAVLIQIERSSRASAQTKLALAQLQREWEPYQQALFASKDPAKMRTNAPRIAELSERVLKGTENLMTLILAPDLAAPR